MKKLLPPLFLCLLIFAAASLCFASSDAQLIETLEDSSEYTESQGGSFIDKMVFAPVPMANPTLGAGLVAVGMYMHPSDSFGNDEPAKEDTTLQSISGAALMGTTNGSWATGLFHKGFYDDDRYRGTAYLAYGEFNLKFYGIGDDSILRDNPIKYSANITAFQPQFLIRVSDEWYIGPKYRFMRWTIGLNLSDLHEKLPDIEHSFDTAGIGLAGEWDTTNHSVYATKGNKFEFSVMDYGDTWGGDFDYAKLESNFNNYYSISDDLILASRLDLNLSTGSTPFFDMPYLHLRGFPYAQYIDKQAASIQAELRYKLTKKWSTNLFGGLGWIGENPDELFRRPTIPTGGAGINYLIAEEQQMYLGMDVAFGPDSKAVYFSVGEWF